MKLTLTLIIFAAALLITRPGFSHEIPPSWIHKDMCKDYAPFEIHTHYPDGIPGYCR